MARRRSRSGDPFAYLERGMGGRGAGRRGGGRGRRGGRGRLPGPRALVGFLMLVLMLSGVVIRGREEGLGSGNAGSSAGGSDRSSRSGAGRVMEDMRRFDRREARVVHVVDGDTVDVQLVRNRDGVEPNGLAEGAGVESGPEVGDWDAETHRVRMLGIDAPEMKDARTGRPGHYAKEATAYVRARVMRGPVTLRLEANETRDRYGRLLAVVWLSENESLNEALVRDGMAYVYRVRGSGIVRSLESVEADAARRRTGLWKEVRKALMPEWRVHWMDERGLDWPP